MSKRTSKKGSFAKGMLTYAIVFLGIVSIGLIILWKYMTAYEKTRPVNVIEAYVDDFDEDRAYMLLEDNFLSSFDNNITSKDAAFEYVKPYLRNINYSKNREESTEDRIVYMLSSGDKTIGRVTLQQIEKKEIDYYFWDVADEELDFSFLRQNESASVTVPQGYSVSCNGYMLGRRYISGTDSDYPGLEYLYDYGVKLPDQLVYTVSNYLGEPEFKVYDADGNQVDKNVNFTALILNNCTEAEQTRISTFIDAYIRKYVSFMGSPRTDIYANYYALSPYLKQGTELQERLYSALEGMVWSNNRVNDIQSISLNSCIHLPDGQYVCDVTYLVRTLGAGSAGEYSTTSNHATVFVEWTAEGLYAVSMDITAEAVNG